MPRRMFVPRDRPLEGRHLAYRHTVEGVYEFEAYDGPDDLGTRLDAYNSGTSELQAIVRDAVAHDRELRIQGREWSLSRVGLCRDRVINPTMLRLLRFFVGRASAESPYDNEDLRLCFLECGESISTVNHFLRHWGRSLRTSGSNDGQTLIGAVSTNTHGSAFSFGATPDFVVALHIVTGPRSSVFLQRASAPAVKPRFAEHFNATHVADDDLFNAALVSFGAMGIIRGFMIDTRPLFIVHAARFQHPFDDALKTATTTLDLSGLDLTRANLPDHVDTDRPHHFQVYFNPNEGAPPDEATVLMLFEDDWESWEDTYAAPERDGRDPVPGAAGLDLVASLLGHLPRSITSAFVDTLNAQMRIRLRPFVQTALLGDLFGGEAVRGKLQVSGTGMPIDHVLEAWDIAFHEYKQLDGILPVLISSRFVKGSEALLAFTKFDPTATLELDTIYTSKSGKYLTNVRRAIAQAGIPHTFHWGKLEHRMSARHLRDTYADRLDRWLAAREALLPTPSVRRIFENDFMRAYGLSSES